MPSDTASLNTLWATLLVEELVRHGVTFFSLAPGSRSTPLALAVARNGRADFSVHFDERGALFLALGHARATGRPAAFVTTSGTAVANALPAVVEADVDGVPLVLLTADRPAELRQTGANQTIDQVKIFGDKVRWFFDLPAPTGDIDPAFVLTTAAQAVFRASNPAHPGPVHLNMPFREPLALPANAPPPGLPEALRSWHAGDAPYTQIRLPHPSGAALLAGEGRNERPPRGLIVAGRLRREEDARYARELAEGLGWPLLADPLSQARFGQASPVACPRYDLVLASPAFADAHRPDAVVVVGDLPVSKRLLTFLRESRPRRWISVHDGPARVDPFHRVTDQVQGVERTATLLRAWGDDTRMAPDAWTQAWIDASATVEALLAETLDAPDALSEPFVARAVTRLVPEGEALFLASSMPVRDVDAFSVAHRGALRTAANRGASGIDGTVASALGFARGHQTGATLLIGDLALLHDLNSLALCRSSPERLVVVCVNNDGGGIFSFLPVAHDAPDVFETLFGTPHGLEFRHAAALFGLDYAAPSTPEGFAEAYRAALARDACTLIEVKTDRAANADLHRRLLDATRAALEG